MSGETWRAIPTFEDIYEVSDLGRVRSLDRKVTQSNGTTISVRGREMKVLPQADGHRYVYLSREGKLAKCNVDDVLREVFGEDVTAAIGEALDEQAPTTSSDLVPFDFDTHQVRVIVDLGGNPWWVAADVCEVLGIANVSDAVGRLSDGDVGTADVGLRGQRRMMKIVNESGLYDLILDSRKPAAKRFRRWITSEVIPSIRKTGSYGPASNLPAIPRTYAELLRAHADLVEAKEAETAARELADAKVLELEPGAQFYDRFMDSGGLSSMTDIADMFGTSVGKFTGWLVDLGIFRKGEYDQFPQRRMPRKRHQDAGLFEVRIECSDRGIRYPVAYATPEGLVFVRKALQENGLVDL